VNAPGSSDGLASALSAASNALLLERDSQGHWVGELCSSALSTATAVIALTRLSANSRQPGDNARIANALRWLVDTQNADGGWGDSVRSCSNVSTTALAWAAFGAAAADTTNAASNAASNSHANADASFSGAVQMAERWLQRACNHSGPGWREELAKTIRDRYGKDRTFSVPILMACTLSGRMGPDGWREIPRLPFELSVLPHQLFGALQLPVVSYALPALIAIGRVIHRFSPTKSRVLRWIRDRAEDKAMAVLERIQPENGGFLEATPLTSFVLMSLAAMGEDCGVVAMRCARFLRASVRPDGSWPIDTNLTTWVTTLSIGALAHQPGVIAPKDGARLKKWILGQQYLSEHPYTHAAPGGWAWTDLPGGVPDADDTAGALLSLLELGTVDEKTHAAAERGLRWLLGLQNRDGGMPTFCRGWGALPFDRSGADLTAHALRAWSAWLPHVDEMLGVALQKAIVRGLEYLRCVQRPGGEWVPLWFGNEGAVGDENPVYGTARVLIALRKLGNCGLTVRSECIRRAEEALVGFQLPDGGWAGGFPSSRNGFPVQLESSIEETALAVESLLGSSHVEVVRRGVAWLVARAKPEEWSSPRPIGFYFAKLWYFERLYPLIFLVSALGAAHADAIQRELGGGRSSSLASGPGAC
jgi:squalene-hopene/tetraprenyl-beta-curcumene cyclase